MFVHKTNRKHLGTHLQIKGFVRSRDIFSSDPKLVYMSSGSWNQFLEDVRLHIKVFFFKQYSIFVNFIHTLMMRVTEEAIKRNSSKLAIGSPKGSACVTGEEHIEGIKIFKNKPKILNICIFIGLSRNGILL